MSRSTTLFPSRWREGAELLPASRLVPSVARPRRLAKRLATALGLFVIFAALAPWNQNVTGTGKVIAFSPDERRQTVQATISGRIGHWHVMEGARVEEGDVLVDLVDNDPNRLSRIEMERSANNDRLEAYESQVLAYSERLEALRRSQSAQIRAAEAEIRSARESLQAKRELLAAAEAEVATAELQQTRISDLAEQGLSSRRERELAELGAATANAKLQSARAGVRAAENDLANKRAAAERVRASTEADLRSATALLRSSETQVASAQASLQSVESRLAQQEAQVVRAPRSGIMQRILVQQGGVQVSRGEDLAYLVPDTQSRAVEIYVDGNDASLISPGRHVRVQFEGWPGVQFAGWPSVAIGTFHGRVAFVDAASDNSQGDFRVVVLADPDDEPWPEARYLRQGTRAKGWVLLDEVSVGFEIWRQLNGFPPSYDSAAEVDEYGGGA
ncbi:MAG: HlyD family efflux transporter periplasmic adaptor subunit [Myxococcota bacterium]